LSVLALQQERIARERATREAELNALLARPAGWPVGRPDPLELTPFTETLDAVLALAKEHAPVVRRERILLVRSQLGIESAKKEYKPDFALSGGYFYMGSMPAMYQVRFDVTLPLQRERRAAAVSEQVSLAGEASEALQGVQLDVQARVEQAFNEGSLSARLALLYRDTVLPQARLALESSMASYETGTIDFLSVLSNFGTVLEYEMTYFEELATYHAAVSRLEEAAGTSIVH
jgi:outer membrane protein TolC